MPTYVSPGEGLFESVRVVAGRTFALERHLERMRRSAAALGMPPVPASEVRRAAAAALAARPGLPHGRLRLTWAGSGTPGECDLGVRLDPVAPREGPETVVTLDVPVDERHPLAGHKATAYLDHVLALAAARERGAGEGIRGNTSGDLCEATAANVFHVLDGRLCTPTLASGALPGVTRSLVLDWCEVVEVDVALREVAERASEVFLTSATRGVQPVSRWDDRTLPAPGPLTRQVQEKWERRVPELLWPAECESPREMR
ncbi:aminotransferase class IV [Nocardioides pantholopis]|uniref:aminotransferase class IV n=1 Tax=Nocardioides pantholopis TaxID=2483798 RepID=UPI0013DE13A9|nr:aminotransferase class IV [Nocardioides pantholopis]